MLDGFASCGAIGADCRVHLVLGLIRGASFDVQILRIAIQTAMVLLGKGLRKKKGRAQMGCWMQSVVMTATTGSLTSGGLREDTL